MDTATTIRFCDLVIALVNFVEFLAFTLPVVGLLACGLFATSRYINRRLAAARHASGQESLRIPAFRTPRFHVPPRRRQPKPDTALIVAA